MEKIIKIGDIHGRGFWETIKKHKADKIIFIGDYFDSFYINFYAQLNNFKEILKFKKENEDRVVLLLGNHDYHYINDGEYYSGYQEFFARDIKAIINDNLNYLKIAHQENFNNRKILYSHAGITKTWCLNNGMLIDDNIDKTINDKFLEKQDILKFVGKNVYGDSIYSSPIWVRPDSLMKDGLDGFTQVVGHTTQDFLNIKTYNGNEYVFIDLPDSFVTLTKEGFKENLYKNFWHGN